MISYAPRYGMKPQRESRRAWMTAARTLRCVRGTTNEIIVYFVIEFDARLLHFAIRQEPDERFVVKIDNLYAVSPRIAKIATERGLQLQFVFLLQFLPDFLQLRFVADHDPEVAHICRLHVFYFEDR